MIAPMAPGCTGSPGAAQKEKRAATTACSTRTGAVFPAPRAPSFLGAPGVLGGRSRFHHQEHEGHQAKESRLRRKEEPVDARIKSAHDGLRELDELAGPGGAIPRARWSGR